ncbi:hypothetical protein BD289DRAFT_478063 [Coniella lustricola]|uniref:Uncharacterized protein n=1 Tax=Coniella lustricola TaxID=2025994 RepID=A0A2T3ANB9_9PEZI|nr:hypothetical protein BD289DRAFT_478063 [Coniella lustricola]
MSCGRTSAGLLLLLSMHFAIIGAHPIELRGQGCPSYACFAPGQPLQTTTSTQTHGGFTTATIIGVSVAIAFVIFLLMSFCYYCIYYKYAKLKLLRQYIERLESLGESLFHHEEPSASSHVAHDNSQANSHRDRPRIDTQSLGQTHALAMLMASSSAMSPDVYSALHKRLEDSISPTSVDGSKTRALDVEDKVLGQCKDLRATPQLNDDARGDGLSSVSRTPP